MMTSSFFTCCLLALLLLLTLLCGATTIDDTPLQLVPQFDCLNTLSCLDHIQVPAYVSSLDTGKALTATDHSVTSALSTTARICKHLGGKGQATCSYLTNRPWRQWRQTLAHSLHHIKTRFIPVIYNAMVIHLNHPYVDALATMQNKFVDWWKLPYLEWERLKARLIALSDHYHYSYLTSLQNANMASNGVQVYSDTCKNNWAGLTNSSNLIIDIDYSNLHEQDDAVLNIKVEDIFQAMTSEQRSYVLRFQQRFTQWATKSSSMTADVLTRIQSLWLQQAETIYSFLDEALSLDPNNDHGQGHLPLTSQLDLCPSVVLPFSISPFAATTQEPSFFSSGTRPQFARTTQPHSDLPLLPVTPHWTACFPKQKNGTNDVGLPKKMISRLGLQLMDRHNKNHHQYLLARLQRDIKNQLERLQKTILQEYLIMVNTTQCQVPDQHYNESQQLRLDHLQSYSPACARHYLYQELRLYISISLRQHFQNAIQQLMDATIQYDQRVMQQVQQAYDEWEWTKVLQARCPITFYPLDVDTTASPSDNDKGSKHMPPSSYQASSITDSRALTSIGQRADYAVEVHRQTVLHQWKMVFDDMERQSHAIWTSAMDEAQGKNLVWLDDNVRSALTILYTAAKWIMIVLFLLYF